MPQVTLPAITDDDGTGQFGTPANKAWSDTVAVELDKHVYSSSNPTEYPKDTIDEVVTARGSKADLNTRMSEHCNADGSLKTPAGLVTAAQAREIIGMKNLLANDTFLIWPTTTAPAHWTLDTGVATRETVEKMIGAASTMLTRAGGVDCKLRQVLLDAAVFQAFFKGEWVHFFCAAKTSVASHARVQIDDGNTTTESSYHTGGGDWEDLLVSHQISGAATKLEANILLGNSNGDAYFDLAAFVWSDEVLPPSKWIPAEKVYGSAKMTVPGDVSIADGKDYGCFARPTLLKELYGIVETAPGGGPVTIDLERSVVGGAFTSIFSAPKDLIADGKCTGSKTPDGSWLYRCADGQFADAGTALATAGNGLFRLNIDAGNAAEYLHLWLRGLQYKRPLEDLIAYDDL